MVVGIDLGTTNSAMAYIDENQNAQIIPNRDGDRVTPSVILFEEGVPIIGSIAKNNSISDPLNVAQFVKRQMGNPNYVFMTDEANSFTPEELSALILKRMVEDAESFLGKSVDKAVITVPAYFNDAQRKATQDAGVIAGLEVLKVINEPTAAALAYGISKGDIAQNILIYDLGGGTFDVTIMNVNQDEINIIATGGDKNLGGFDFDNELIQYVVNEFMNEFDFDLYDDEYAMQDLREKSEACKKVLSNRTKSSISISSNGNTKKIEVTKEQYGEMIKPLLDRTLLIMDMVRDDAGMEWSHIDKILLVGGSTRIRVIQELIEHTTGIKPSSEVNPDEVVAIGAAYQAHLLDCDSTEKPESLKRKIIDVNSHSLGVLISNPETEQMFNKIILPKNTPIPAEADSDFITLEDDQDAVFLNVTEGEDEDPDYVNVIGEVILKLKLRPAGSPIRVILSYDENSIVHVHAIDLIDHSTLGEMKIERTSNLSDLEVSEKKNKISKLIVD